MDALRAEVGRKAFHMLCLIYLAGYMILGWPSAFYWLSAWFAVVVLIEVARLRSARLRSLLEGLFGSMVRDLERHSFSGIFHTTAGCLAVIALARGRGVIVAVAIGQLALADSAAALFGRAFGRTKLWGGRKSLEGTLAAFATAYALALWLGVGSVAALASSFAAAGVELVPTTAYFNDNFWLPVASAVTLLLLRVS